VFQFTVRVVSERRERINLGALQKAWWNSLVLEGLASKKDQESPHVRVVKGQGGGKDLLRWVCGISDTWLAPVKEMHAIDAIAYQGVLQRLFKSAFRSKRN